jgi:hypothetical protein
LPLPLPDPPLVIVIHDTGDEAVQPQPLPALTLTLPVPPSAGTVWLFDPIEYVHGTADCVIVAVFPPTAIEPFRTPPPFAVTANDTVPLPDPDAPEAIVIHGVFELAVHAQPAAAVTVMVPVPASAVTFWVVGAISTVHGVGSPGTKALCSIDTPSPPMLTVPRRSGPVFGATATATVPARFPLPFAVTVIQLASGAAVHAQPVSVPTEIVRVPPAAETAVLVGETV